MMAAYEYIRRFYGLSYEPGQRVRHTVTNNVGTVCPMRASHGHYVQVRFDGLSFAQNCHPEELEQADG